MSSSAKLVLLVIAPIILNNNQVVREAIIKVMRMISVPWIHRFSDMIVMAGRSVLVIFSFIAAVDIVSARPCLEQSKITNAVVISVDIERKNVIRFAYIWLT